MSAFPQLGYGFHTNVRTVKENPNLHPTLNLIKRNVINKVWKIEDVVKCRDDFFDESNMDEFELLLTWAAPYFDANTYRMRSFEEAKSYFNLQ